MHFNQNPSEPVKPNPQGYPNNPYGTGLPQQPPTPPQALESKTEVIKKTSKKTNPLVILFRFIAIILILTLIVATGIIAFTLSSPQHPFSQWIVNNTPLNELVDLPGGEENDTSSSSSSESKPINNIIQGNGQSGEQFQFAEPAGTRPAVEVVQDVLPSVLSLSLKTRGEGLSEELTSGTGYIVSEDGLVVSNKHVVNVVCGTNTNQIQITALTHDQKALNLELLSIDPVDDIAILRIIDTNQRFVPLNLADSDQLRLGQDVLTVGNVLGELQNTVTRGIVSGLDRSFETDLVDPCTSTKFQADGLIQTDAAINRGNSGGPLFNSAGQLIGMNTLGTTDSENIGLAIPTSTLQTVLRSYQANQKIIRARLGVSSLQINALRRAQNAWIPTEYGEIIFARTGEAIATDSPAATAGLKEGDIILEVNGERLETNNSNPSPLRRAVLRQQAGNKVTLRVLKATGASDAGYTYGTEQVNVDVTLGSISYDLVTRQVVLQ